MMYRDVRDTTRILGKRLEMQMLGVKPGKKINRKYIINRWWGKVVRHKLYILEYDKVENTTLRVKITRTGIFKWFTGGFKCL